MSVQTVLTALPQSFLPIAFNSRMVCLAIFEILLVALMFQNQVKYLNVTCSLNELPVFCPSPTQLISYFPNHADLLSVVCIVSGSDPYSLFSL